MAKNYMQKPNRTLLTNSNKCIFLVLGRLGPSLSISKILPFVEVKTISNIFVFTQHKLKPIQKVIYIKLPYVFNNKNKLRKLLRLIYEPLQIIAYGCLHRPTVIFGFYTLPKGFNSFVSSKLLLVKCVIAILGGKNEIEKKYMKTPALWEKLNLFMLKHIDLIFTKGTKDNRYLFSKGFSKENMMTYNGAIDYKKIQNENQKRDIDILFVGTLYERKGPDRLLYTIKKVVKDFPEIRAIFLGEGEMLESLKKKVENNLLQKNVEFKGYVNDVHNYLKHSKMLVMPSRAEGLSTAMLEAMACGCVPIVSNVDNQTVAAKHYFNSLVVENYCDVDLFSDYIKELLINPQLRVALSENAMQFVKQYYSPNAQAKILIEAFKYLEES